MEKGSGLYVIEEACKSSSCIDRPELEVNESADSDVSRTEPHKLTDFWTDISSHHMTLLSPAREKGTGFEKEEETSSVLCVTNPCVKNVEAAKNTGTPEIIYVMEPHPYINRGQCNISEDIARNQTHLSNPPSDVPVEWIGMMRHNEGDSLNKMVVQSVSDVTDHECHQPVKTMKVQTVMGHTSKGGKGSEVVTCMQQCSVEDISSIIRQVDAVSIVIISDNTDWLQQVQSSCVSAENAPADEINLVVPSDNDMEMDATSCKSESHLEPVRENVLDQGSQPFAEKENNVCTSSKHLVLKRPRQPSSSSRESKIPKLITDSEKVESRDLIKAGVSACVQEQISDSTNSCLQTSAPSPDTEPFSDSQVSTPSLTALSFRQISPRSLQSKPADFKLQLVRNADNRNIFILPPQPEASHMSSTELSPAMVTFTDAKDQEHQGDSQGGKEPTGPVAVSGTQSITQEVSDAVTESCKEKIRISGLEVSITNSKGECLGEVGVMYRCTECDYVSSNKHYYKQHVDLVHNTTRPYKCPYCDYAGKRSHALREHLLVHSVQRPFSCTQCNATFRKKGHLTNHTKLHATTTGAAAVAGMSSSDTASLIGGSFLGKVPASTSFISSPTTIISPARITPSVSPVLSSSIGVLGNIAVENAGAAQGMSSTAASHVLGGSAISEDKASNTSGLWCALCNHAMADAKTFEMHLQTVHKTDRLYMCETCDYVASDKAGIMSHLPTHLETSTSANDLLSCNASSVTQPSTSNITVIYTCAECGFESQTLQILRTHALKHNAGASPLDGQEESSTTEVLEQPLQKVVCAVCGLVSDSTDIMRTHMWSHITAGAESVAEEQRTTRPVNQDGSEQLHMALPVSGGNPVQILQDAVTAPAGLKVLPHNAAFQCTECSFVSRNASLFIRHMLQHKTQQSQASRAQVQSVQKVNSPTVSFPAQTGSPEMAIKMTQSYKVKPVTTENTCQNTESSPFVHDEATGRFRCTICGYTCEYQRTIKAHIWKHSGHQQVDYPIFQNGPLSMYDEPAPASFTSISCSPQFSNTTSQPSVVFSSASEHHKPPVVIVTKSNTGITPSPRSVQFVTKDGVPTAAPSGIYKLTPVFQISASNPAPLSANNSNKHIVLQVQSGSADGITASTDGDMTKAVQQSKAAEELTAACRVSGSSMNEKTANKESCIIDCRKVSNTDVLTGKARTNTVSSESEQLIGRYASPNQEKPDVMCSTANARKLELIKEVSSVHALSKQVITLGRSSIMPAANHQETASEVPLPTKGCSQGQATSSKFIYLKVVPEQRREGTGEKSVFLQGESAVLMTGDEKPLDVEGIFCSSKGTSKLADGCSVQSQQGHHLAGSLPPNVVVEVVPAVSSGADLTGLHSRSNSPRSLHGMKGSPAFEGSSQEAALTAHPETRRSSSEEIVGDNIGILKKSKGESRERDVPDDSRNSLQPRGSSIARAGDNVEKTSEAGIQLGQSNKSELAVTLLSLLQKEPKIEPACPQRSLSTEEVPDEAAASQESPSRPPSTMSDTDSASKDTAYGDAGSEDLTSEGESAVVGRDHGRGGRGICSSLLAVIEQLRERSKSESDIEDKSAQNHPPPKKRSSRRRGQRALHDDALVMEDCANIEHVTADDGVAYRCKLCHYTSSRTPLIRLHMRTHRPKEPFECSLCTLVADSNEELQEHMMQHCKARTYPCKFCPQLFNHKSTLRAHMRAHNDADPFLCDLCDFETSSPLEYRAHMQKHSSRALIRCPRCPAILTSRQDLGLHIRSGCPMKGSTRICGSPGRDHNANNSLGMALAEENTGSEQLACLRCGFRTHDVKELKEHVSSHLVTGSMGSGVGWVEVDPLKEPLQEPLQCALCDFTAVSTRSLKSHMKRHANDQRYVQQPLEQYKCSLCGYICHHLPSLKSHMWRHASDANYSYQFTNDVINAAIDYDTRADVSSIPGSPVAAADTSDTNGPELLEKVFSAERRIIEGQLSKTTGGARPVCWVTFCCCQCGFETINKAKLNLHMRTHADIINRTLRIGSTQGIDGIIQSHQGENVKCLDPSK